MTIDYDFWVDLPERQYVRLLTIVQRLGGTIRAQTPYEVSDGAQVNAVFSRRWPAVVPHRAEKLLDAKN